MSLDVTWGFSIVNRDFICIVAINQCVQEVEEVHLHRTNNISRMQLSSCTVAECWPCRDQPIL